MAFSASNAPIRFKSVRIADPDDVYHIPGIPGTTYEAGNVVVKKAVGATANAGLFDEAADSGAGPYWIVNKTTVCSANTNGFPNLNDPVPFINNAQSNSLIPVRLAAGGGFPIFTVPIGNYTDDTVSAYTSATPSITLTTALGADDDPNGALVYVYGGTGAGQWNMIVDYANGTKIATLARKFQVDLSTDSTVIILEGEGSSVGGLGPFGRTDLDTVSQVDASDGADDGDWIVVMDCLKVREFLQRGALPVAQYHHFA